MILADAVFETTRTEGVGDIALQGAVTGYNAFASAFADGDLVSYVIEQRTVNDEGAVTGIMREAGIGKLTLGAANTLARKHVTSSSNGNLAVAFPAGEKDVFCSPVAAAPVWGLAPPEARNTAKALNVTHGGMLLLLNAAGGALRQALPPLRDVFPGWRVTITKTDNSANAITIDPDGVEQVDGARTRVLRRQGDLAELVAGAAQWHIRNKIEADPSGHVGDIIYSAANSREGWLIAAGLTIGLTAGQRQGAQYQDLFNLLWGAGAAFAVSGGRGASAAADWAGNKSIATPDLRGRAVAGRDNLNGAARNLVTAAAADTMGGVTGTETVTLAETHLPNISGGFQIRRIEDADIITDLRAPFSTVRGDGSFTWARATNSQFRQRVNFNFGGGRAHNNMSPTMFLNAFIKY